MAISIVDIAASEVARLVAIEEGHFADAKAIEIAPAKLTRSLSALANADGGDIYVGLDQDKRAKTFAWRGFPDVEAANGHLQAFEQTFPLDGFVEYQFIRDASAPEKGLILKASILKTPDIRTASDGGVYVRRGAQNLPVTGVEEKRRLEYAKGIRSFETYPVDVPLEVVTNSETIIGFMLDVVPTGEPEPWLRKQLLIREDKPTVAAMLVFADEPQVGLPKQSTIKV
ncbi:MAG TPA: RNA-binding domain-containing protein [Gaiellaceae bacterium]